MRWLLKISTVLFLMIGTYALMGPNSSSMVINVFKAIHSEAIVNQQAIFDYIQFAVGLIFLSFALTWIAMAYMLKKLLMIRKATYDNHEIYSGEEKRHCDRRESDKEA
ncbi:MAG: hypothetical protein Q7U10_08435 [Thermodesulfovibrionia bacterium]|nr:hypothetical protein [Thermodesulfovibrionia bacterium]